MECGSLRKSLAMDTEMLCAEAFVIPIVSLDVKFARTSIFFPLAEIDWVALPGVLQKVTTRSRMKSC